jgi:epsin
LQALAVIEYLLANGSERAVDDIIDNSSQIAVCVTSLFFVELSLFRLHSACP